MNQRQHDDFGGAVSTEVISQGLQSQADMGADATALPVEAERAAAEIKAAMVVAQSRPRDEVKAFNRIMKACKRKSLAEQAVYVFPRGGQKIVGPSIRLMEVIAQQWGNIRCGVQELKTGALETTMRAYAWDLETNFADEKTFSIEHVRDARGKRIELETQRDIYENNANFAARRKRACLISVIPKDIVEAAQEQCTKTLTGGDEPIADRVRKMVVAFEEVGVTQAMIEGRLGHKLEATIAAELVTLQGIFRSIRDGMSAREDHFTVDAAEKGGAASLNKSLKGKGKKADKDAAGGDEESGLSDRE